MNAPPDALLRLCCAARLGLGLRLDFCLVFVAVGCC
jgi:hypothetical protein